MLHDDIAGVVGSDRTRANFFQAVVRCLCQILVYLHLTLYMSVRTNVRICKPFIVYPHLHRWKVCRSWRRCLVFGGASLRAHSDQHSSNFSRGVRYLPLCFIEPFIIRLVYYCMHLGRPDHQLGKEGSRFEAIILFYVVLCDLLALLPSCMRMYFSYIDLNCWFWRTHCRIIHPRSKFTTGNRPP